MDFSHTKSGSRTEFSIVERRGLSGQPQLRAVATVGRLDEPTENGQLEVLRASGPCFARDIMLLTACECGEVIRVRKISKGCGLNAPLRHALLRLFSQQSP